MNDKLLGVMLLIFLAGTMIEMRFYWVGGAFITCAIILFLLILAEMPTPED